MTDSEPKPPTLIVTGGPQDGATISCDDPSGIEVLGSGDQARVRITLGNVAAIHAQIQWESGQLFLEDAGSSTGTYLNGEKITERRPVVEGDRVYLGPPGSPDSASLLVCPPLESEGAEDLQLEAPPSSSIASDEPLILDAPAPGPEAPAALDLEPPTPSPSAAPEGSLATSGASGDTASKPLPLIPPPPGSTVRRPSRADYNTEVPSIAPDRVREPIQLPASPTSRKPAATRGRRKVGLLDRIPRAALIGGATTILGIAAVVGYSFLHTPPPVIMSVAPLRAEPGTTVTVKGVYFGRNRTVHLGADTPEVLSASDGEVTFRVPNGKAPGSFPLSVETRGGRSSATMFEIFRTPRLTGLNPSVAMPDQEVTITGENLGGTPKVMVGGLTAEILDAKPTVIRMKVPKDLAAVEGKAVDVVVKVGTDAAKPMDLIMGHLPLLIDATPASGPAGIRTKIRGRGFSADPPANVVSFGSQRAVVLTASANELEIATASSEVPGNQLTVPVTVEVGGSRSTVLNFVLMRPSAGFFTPRFYPMLLTDGPGHQHVVIATDLGPFMLLGGKDAAASVPERALAVSDALNNLVSATASGQHQTIEAREKPRACVAVAGAAGCLADVTPEDLAAYDEGWGATKSAKATPRGLATHWAALVDDYLTMFVAKQRPYRTLETSPRGKTLLELYGEATRRNGPGSGIATNLVSPLPTRLGGELKELALVLPQEAPGKGSGAIEGLWTGTMEDPSGTREMKIRFQVQGGKLSGTLTTLVRRLTMDSPLENLSYDHTAIQFVARLGGESRTFRGSLQQGQIAGSVYVGQGKDAAGRFTLNFVE